MVSSYVMAVLVDKRTEDAPLFQEVITKHGCLIRVRLGDNKLSPNHRNWGYTSGSYLQLPASHPNL